MRQHKVLTEYDPKRGVAIATLAYDYPAQYDVPEHAHGSDQIIYATSGIMEISSGQSAWFIPPHFALWIPARTRHRIHMPGPVSMRTIYLRGGLTARAAPGCEVLHVTPLLRELIIEAVNAGQLRVRDRYESALSELLLHQIRKASSMPTCVTLPREKRALAVAQAILRDPAESKTMAVLCSQAGVSVRTIERSFRKEVGTSFASWRRQVRLTKAVELLVAGYSVKEVAYKVGFCQSSAFVVLFRRTFGTTPKTWTLAVKKLS